MDEIDLYTCVPKLVCAPEVWVCMHALYFSAFLKNQCTQTLSQSLATYFLMVIFSKLLCLHSDL
uniref:Uncharacterized protein n=1 Tax=Arundo donax TaxID=35708 RepID=A0A0A8Z3X0_ARUDO